MIPKHITIDGKQHLWSDIAKIRRDQLAALPKVEQMTLFEMVDDYRPASQASAAARYAELWLFDIKPK
jgi:hypothetical protein